MNDLVPLRRYREEARTTKWIAGIGAAFSFAMIAFIVLEAYTRGILPW